MDSWVLWLVLACLFGIGEMITNGLFLAPFAAGALVAALLSAVGGGAVIATVSFFVVGLAVLLFLRPLAMRHRRGGPLLRTGAAALVGKNALVMERIANDEGVGCVKIDGEIWTARAYSDHDVIEAGEHVDVVEIRGATALVMR
jgi:membrane protein implicated in regulation of membrane protease activity